jgi:hypothetical protein
MLRADRTGQQRSPAGQGNRGHGQHDLVQQPGIVELPGKIATADDPDRPAESVITSRVCDYYPGGKDNDVVGHPLAEVSPATESKPRRLPEPSGGFTPGIRVARSRYRRVAAVKARPLTLLIVFNPVSEEAIR